MDAIPHEILPMKSDDELLRMARQFLDHCVIAEKAFPNSYACCVCVECNNFRSWAEEASFWVNAQTVTQNLETRKQIDDRLDSLRKFLSSGLN